MLSSSSQSFTLTVRLVAGVRFVAPIFVVFRVTNR
jgi:hypothetical protein